MKFKAFVMLCFVLLLFDVDRVPVYGTFLWVSCFYAMWRIDRVCLCEGDFQCQCAYCKEVREKRLAKARVHR